MNGGFDNPMGDTINLPDYEAGADTTAAPSAITMDYYRQKALQFQATLNSLDAVSRDLYDAGTVAYATGDATMIAQYEDMRAELDSKKSQFLSIMEAINFASQGINAVGINFPRIQAPFGMGAIPLVPVAVIAGAVALIEWATGFFSRVANIVQSWVDNRTIEMLPESERAAAYEVLQKTRSTVEVAKAQATGSSLAQLATIAKWGAVGLGLFLAWKMMKDQRG